MTKISYTLAGLAAISATGLLAWQAQQTAAKLPAPFSTPSSNNRPNVVTRPEGAQLKVPQGFALEEYMTGFKTPRFMLYGPSGEILLSDATDGGGVYSLVDKNRKLLIDGLDRPYGLALWKDYLYIGERTSVKRYKYDS